jgi:hypothetical protein
MTVRHTLSVVAIAVGLVAGPGMMVRAQDTPVPKDDAVESLLREISNPSDSAGKEPAKSTKKKDAPDQKKPGDSASAKGDPGGKPAAKPTAPGGGKTSEKAASKPGSAASLSGKDKEVDELLEKLGETKETPSPDERPRSGAGGGEKTEGRQPAGKPDKTDRSRLSGKDKETDEHLEELTGRKRRKKDDDERSGPAGQIIKEMRDIEQKLAKPDTGESTREEQKKVVKRIESLIEEMKRSGQSSMGRMMIRRVNRPGQQQPGRQRRSTDGAMARGAPLTKPARPTTKRSTAGGQDIWGHLPDEMQYEMNNMFNELPLSIKEELIERYYLSVGTGKLKREETP